MEINTMNQGKKRSAKQRSMTSAALAVALMFGGLSFSANAMVLGPVRVNSALGEPLKAEVTITDLTKDEVASLQVTMAAPADFGSRGLIYNSVLSSIRVSYEVTGSNTAVVRFTSSRPIQEPFIDLLMDVRWRAGNMQRSYTMLIDPPRTILAPTNTVTSTAPVATQVSVLSDSTPVTSAPTNRPANSSVSITTRHYDADGNVIGSEALGRDSVGGQAPASRTATAQTGTSQVSTVPSGAQNTNVQPTRTQGQSSQFPGTMTVKVSRGQTLGQIANATRPAGVTTEQMLVALYRANPSAFIHRNMNWVKAGATLVIPSDSEIASISVAEARREVSAHAREFNARISNRSEAPRVESPAQQGTIDSITSGGTNATTRPDNQLRIEQGDPNTARIDTGTLIEQRNHENQTRQDEVQGHIDELGTIVDQINQPSQPTVVTPPVTTGPIVINEPVVTGPVVNEPPATDVDVEPQPGPLAVDDGQQGGVQVGTLEGRTDIGTRGDIIPDVVTPDPEPVDVAPEPIPDPVPSEPASEPQPLPRSIIDDLLDNPLIPLAGVGALLVIVGGGVFVMRRRKKAKEEGDFYDEEEDDDDVSADSFFAENHSQQSSNMLDQSSSIYAASQLDTNADVDPVQEADVYLAYGRDEQAAEILRDALLEEPDRIALHAKLCEVYARQNNVSAFDEQAAQLRALTSGEGPEWMRIVRLAQNISPNNPLYTDTIETKALDGGKVAAAAAAAAAVEASQPLMNSRQSSSNAQSLDSHMMDASELLGGEQEGAGSSDGGYDASLDVSLELDGADTQVNDSSNSSSVFDEDDEEGPSTRLALAEEFYAIGNKKDAKEIIEEVLAQDVPAEVRQKASSLLNKVS